MYAFYSLLIYIFYSLFRRDGGAAAASDPGDPTQVSGVGLNRGWLPPPPRDLVMANLMQLMFFGVGSGE